MSKFIPMLFSTPMVLAIQDGRKTMTRRVNGLEKLNASPNQWKFLNMHHFSRNNLPCAQMQKIDSPFIDNIKCPYGEVGDIIWVRESFKPKYVKGGLAGFRSHYPLVYPWFYMADAESEDGYGPWKPSIHMPKAACRLFLQIESIRVETLHDITEEDAKSEGAEPAFLPDLGNTWKTYRQGFEYLWQRINGEESWTANPFVWVVTFKKIDKPENFI